MKAFIGIGSNIGNKIDNCLKAISMINELDSCSVIKCSSFYETEPVGYKDQSWFINCIVLIETGFSPYELLFQLQHIEKAMGRIRNIKWGPRIIDLDIIMYEDMVINSDGLIIPHPLMHKRNFVLIPMSEIAPEVVHPVLKKSIKQLLKDLSGDGQKVIMVKG